MDEEKRINGQGLEVEVERESGEADGGANVLDRPLGLVGRGRRKARRGTLSKRRKGRKFTQEQRVLILDSWQRSGLGAPDFAPLVGVSTHTLYGWRKAFQQFGLDGLANKARAARPDRRLPEATKRAILMLKREHPEYGSQRISDELARGPGLGASATAVSEVLKADGYQVVEQATKPHRSPTPRRFEREQPDLLWQTDLFTFTLKRQNRRVYLVAFMDDHSRYIVGYGLHGTQSTAMVLEVLRQALTSFGPPVELLTDNGTQFVTWRGKSAFTKECEKRGIKQIVAKPKRPQTLGKIERFWGTLWRDCVETAIFADLQEARQRVGQFIDHYNFHRPHQGIGGLVPADRYFGAATKVREALQARVADNALELARHGVPKQPFYLTGKVGEQAFSVHAEGERVILTKGEGEREEIALVKPEKRADGSLPEPLAQTAAPPDAAPLRDLLSPPGSSPLDEGLQRLLAMAEDEQESR